VYDDVNDDDDDCDDDDCGVGDAESDDDNDDNDDNNNNKNNDNNVRCTLFYTNIHLFSLLFIQTTIIPLVVDIFQNHSHLLMSVTYQI